MLELSLPCVCACGSTVLFLVLGAVFALRAKQHQEQEKFT
jgi:hypothetical protein